MTLREYKVFSKNVRGKKTRNPGYEPGNHWVVCDICACSIREHDAMQTWQGYVVCPDDWEPRHPQDFVRARADDTAAKGLVRPEPSNNLDANNIHNAIPSLAIAGYAWPSVPA